MARVNLPSSSLQTATYQDQSALLELEFRSGAIYRYLGVPAQIYEELLTAKSKGGYFNQHIRNCFTHTQIAPRRNGATGGSTVHKATE